MITSTKELKQYISVSQSFVFEEIAPYLKKAQREFMKKYVGNLYSEIGDLTIDNELKEEVTDLVYTATANFAYFLFTPFNSVTMDASGMANVTTQNRSNLTMFQLNDIRRELLRSAHSAMDELLEVLEANSSVFTEWNASYSTVYQKNIVNSTSVFQSGYNIHNSRQTFLALLPSIELIEDQLLASTFCGELLDKLKKGKLTARYAHLKSLLAKAVVNATVAKVCAEGVFEITSSGIRMKFDLLPYEQSVPVVMNEQLAKKIDNLQSNATQYLMMAREYIAQHAEDFTECDGGALLNKEGKGYRPIITRSIIGL